MVDINPKDIVNKNSSNAEKYLKDKNKLQKLIDDAAKKASVKNTSGPIDELFTKVKLLIGIIADYISGGYREIPWGSLVMIVAALLYFVSPIDLIPDFIPGVGYIDDIAVIAFVIKQISSDLEKYKEWKRIA